MAMSPRLMRPSTAGIGLSYSMFDANTIRLTWVTSVPGDYDIYVDGVSYDTSDVKTYDLDLRDLNIASHPIQIRDSATQAIVSNTVTISHTYSTAAADYLSRLALAGKLANWPAGIANDTCLTNGTTNGWLSKVYDSLFMDWGLAAANRIKLKGTGSAAAFAGGTTTHNSKSITFSSNGYLNTNIVENAVGWSSTSAFVCIDLAATVASPASVLDFGGTDGGGSGVQGALCFNTLGQFIDCTERTSVSAASAAAGIYLFNKTSASQIDILLYNGSGKTVLYSGVLGGTALNPNTTTTPIALGGRNLNGVVDSFTNCSYRSILVGGGLSQSQADLMLVDLWTRRAAMDST